MPLVTSTEMFRKAYEGGYAVGAFNVNNMEIIQGITEGGRRDPFSADFAGLRRREKVCQAHLSHEAGRGCHRRHGSSHCLHLDHGENFDICKSWHRRRLYLRHDRRQQAHL